MAYSKCIVLWYITIMQFTEIHDIVIAIYIYIHTYIHIQTYTYVYVYTYIYIYTYVYTHTYIIMHSNIIVLYYSMCNNHIHGNTI